MEQWKSLRAMTDTVEASLPDQGSPMVRHRHAGGQFRVYRTFHHGGRPYLGSSVINLGPDELKPSPERWAQALAQAALVDDPWYPLEVPASASQPSSTSTLEKQDLARWIEPFEQVLTQALRAEPVLPVREHLTLTKKIVQYRDFTGLERDEVRYTASLEVLLVPKDAPEAHPFSAELRFSEFAPHLITGFLQDQARLTVDAYHPQPWEPEGEFGVLLQGPALAGIFDYLLGQLGGPALAAGQSELALHQRLWQREGSNPLTITALAERYNSPESGGFDDEGLVLNSHTLVRDGTVKGFWTTQATAHWLGLPLTGRPRNYSVSPGTQDRKALAGQRIVEIHRLRWAEVDTATGEFSAEVGLADLHEGGQRRPIFGFTLKGNLKDALTKGRFSSDVGTWEHYEGPEFLVVPSTFFRSV